MRGMDTMKELYLDYNMTNLIYLHNHLQNEYQIKGFLNTSKSFEFIHCILDNMFIVNNNVQILYGNAEDEES